MEFNDSAASLKNAHQELRGSNLLKTPSDLSSSDEDFLIICARGNGGPLSICGAGRRNQHFNHSRTRLALLRKSRSRVEIKCDPAVGVPEQFLGRFDVHAEKPQICTQQMPERVPAYDLLYNAGPLCGWADSHTRPKSTSTQLSEPLNPHLLVEPEKWL